MALPFRFGLIFNTLTENLWTPTIKNECLTKATTKGSDIDTRLGDTHINYSWIPRTEYPLRPFLRVEYSFEWLDADICEPPDDYPLLNI